MTVCRWCGRPIKYVGAYVWIDEEYNERCSPEWVGHEDAYHEGSKNGETKEPSRPADA